MWKIRPPKNFARKILSRLHLPVLTGAEKSALGILLALLAAGAGMRAWERTGVALGPVRDWDSLRQLVIHAPKPDGVYPCGEASFAFSGEESPRDGFLRAGAKKASGKGAGKKMGPARPVDLNTASETQLTTLPGVGPSTAKAIVAYRMTHGKFNAPEDLLNVKGIGPKKFGALEKFVQVKGADPERPPTVPADE